MKNELRGRLNFFLGGRHTSKGRSSLSRRTKNFHNLHGAGKNFEVERKANKVAFVRFQRLRGLREWKFAKNFDLEVDNAEVALVWWKMLRNSRNLRAFKKNSRNINRELYAVYL